MRFTAVLAILFGLLLLLSGISLHTHYVSELSLSAVNHPFESDSLIPDKLKTHYLPQWLFDFADQNDSVILVLGISDPGLNACIAETQAFARIKMILSLMLNSKVTANSNLYNKVSEFSGKANALEGNSKYARLYEWSSMLNLNPQNLKLIDSTTTVYGEKIILANYTPSVSYISPPAPDSVEVRIDILDTEYGKNADFLQNGLLWLNAKANGDFHQFRMYHESNRTNLFSFYNDSLLAFKTDYFKYLAPVRNMDPDSLPASKLFHGLWKAYIENLCYQVLNLNTPDVLEVRMVKDVFSATNGIKNQTSDLKALSAEMYVINTSFRLNKILIAENEMKLDITFKKNSIPYEK